MKKLTVDVWSDIACPWCYVGKRRLEAALERFPHRDQVTVVWHAFELDPTAPRERDDSVSYAGRLAAKYGRSKPEAQAMIDNMTRTGAADGLDLHFEKVRSGNTFDAHRLIAMAAAQGKGGQAEERLFRAYMTEGELVSDPDVLVRLGGELGLDPDEVRAMLAGDAFTAEVRSDEQAARQIGIRGVPFFVLGQKYGVSGAQPPEVLLGALTKAWEDHSAAEPARDEV
jgi:predicted DsbA family dithiol-disulfide isomerase